MAETYCGRRKRARRILAVEPDFANTRLRCFRHGGDAPEADTYRRGLSPGTLDRLRQEDGFTGYVVQGTRFDIGLPDAYRQTVADFRNA